MSIEPTPEQVERLMASDDQSPTIMINLLRFQERADGIDEADGITAADAYARYAAGVEPFLAGVGGRLLLAVAATESVVGPYDGEWDMMVAVEYPSRAAFLKMATNPEYRECTPTVRRRCPTRD
jgi:uncharacterized protein (DUF1330 family)